MPIYEYQCEKCEGVFEAIQKFSDAPLDACRVCGEGPVRKLVSAPAFRLKGSGWYETDFKKDRQRNVAKADSDGGGSGASRTGASESSASKDSGGGDAAKKSGGSKTPDAA